MSWTRRRSPCVFGSVWHVTLKMGLVKLNMYILIFYFVRWWCCISLKKNKKTIGSSGRFIFPFIFCSVSSQVVPPAPALSPHTDPLVQSHKCPWLSTWNTGVDSPCRVIRHPPLHSMHPANTSLQCISSQWSLLQCTVLQCSVLQCSIVQCSAVTKKF